MVPRSLTLTLFSNHSSLCSSLVPRFVLSLVSRFLHAGTFVVLHSFLARPSCSCISLVSYFTLPLVVSCSYLARSLSYLDRTSFVSRSQSARTSLLPRSYPAHISLAPCSYPLRTSLVVSRTSIVPHSYLARSLLVPPSYLDRTLVISHSHISLTHLLVSFSYLVRSLSYLDLTSFVSRSQPARTSLLPQSYRFRISPIHSSVLDRTLLVSHSHLSRMFFVPRPYLTHLFLSRIKLLKNIIALSMK